MLHFVLHIEDYIKFLEKWIFSTPLSILPRLCTNVTQLPSGIFTLSERADFMQQPLENTRRFDRISIGILPIMAICCVITAQVGFIEIYSGTGSTGSTYRRPSSSRGYFRPAITLPRIVNKITDCISKPKPNCSLHRTRMI